jgi:ribosomal protein S18 acetylase RimI-like enzyme
MSEVTIHTPHPDDWRRLRALRLEALATDPQAFGATLADEARLPEAAWRARIADACAGERAWLLVAERGGRMVGMVGALVKDDPGTAEAIAFFVTPAARQGGVGAALLDRLITRVAFAPTVDRIDLRVREGQVAAVALYRRAGFDEVGRESDDSSDGSLASTLVMRRVVTR